MTQAHGAGWSCRSFTRHPESYAFGAAEIPEVARTMTEGLRTGNAVLGEAGKAAARTLGIKATEKAIREWLNADAPPSAPVEPPAAPVVVAPSVPSTSLRQRREEDYLDKTRNVGGRLIALRTLITELVQQGGATLSYEAGTGKKRDGLRMPTAPTWNLFAEGVGYEVGKIGAPYAASLFRVNPTQFQRIAEYEAEFGTTIKHRLSVLEEANRGTPYPMRAEDIAAATLAHFDEPIRLPPGQWTLPAGAYGDANGPL